MHLQYLCFFDCHADFDVDNVQHRELVNFMGYSAMIYIIIIMSCAAPSGCPGDQGVPGTQGCVWLWGQVSALPPGPAV